MRVLPLPLPCVPSPSVSSRFSPPATPPARRRRRARPTADVTWQWQLDGPIDTGYDVDLYDECAQLAPFAAAGKPVLNVEYAGSRAEAEALARTVCPASAAAGLRTLLLPPALDDAFRVSCVDLTRPASAPRREGAAPTRRR